MPKLSACVLTYNEATNISELIKDLDFCDEIVVLDHFSTDGTDELVKQFPNTKLVQETFKGFKTQKNRAVQLASHDWVLSLDADERLDDEAKQGIMDRLINPQHVYAFRLARKCFYLGRWIRHGGWYPDYQIRFFNRRYAVWGGGETHEYVKVSETPIGTLQGNILHYSFKDLTHQVEKNNFYSTRMATQILEKKKFILGGMLLNPFITFFRMYILKLGFLDAWPGLIVAINSAYSTFLKYAKAWENSNVKPYTS